MSMKDNHVAIILEDMNRKFDIVFEMASNIGQMMQDIQVLKRDVAEIQKENAVFKAALKDTSHQVYDHEVRITRLETV